MQSEKQIKNMHYYGVNQRFNLGDKKMSEFKMSEFKMYEFKNV